MEVGEEGTYIPIAPPVSLKMFHYTAWGASRQTDRQTETEIEKDRETERDRDRETERQANN